MMQVCVCVYDPSSRIFCGSLDLCVCFQETRLADSGAKRVYQATQIYKIETCITTPETRYARHLP